jgi:bifunctional DNA-binding transcriptional regulator/antitoxin component of YhaV-PrlF toxin-antitoxin module
MMKALGIVRKLDDLGRVVIPMEIRRSQDWEKNQSLEMFMDGDKLVLQAYGKEQEKEEAINKLRILLKSEPTKNGIKMLNDVLDYLEG